MNNLIPDWNFDSETNHKISPPDNDLVELLWQNGQLVLQSQSRRRQLQTLDDDPPLINVCSSLANSTSNITQDDDQTVSWVHDPFLDTSGFSDKKFVTFPSVVDSNNLPVPKFTRNPMRPPILPDRKGSLNLTQGRDAMVGSSHCGSNQLLPDIDFGHACASSNGVHTSGPSAGPINEPSQRKSDGFKTETLEPMLTSSSGGSGSSLDQTCKQSTDLGFHKRKNRDVEEPECQSDDAAEVERGRGNKSGQRSGSARRSRAAQVHNLSERRRRDRINEKMRALQELIPHSNKADKASMLDEAIEYLKSLQFQLQLMWMGSSGMAPMMFQGMHRYMSCMGMGMGMGVGMGVGPPLPHVNNPMQLLVDQSMAAPPPQNQSVNYQSQMQNANFSNQYARYMGFQSMQQSSQPGNVFGFGSQNSQLIIDNSGTFNVEGAGATCNTLTSEKTG